MHEYEVPLTAAEEAANDPLVKWDRGMPRPEPRKRKQLDIPQLNSNEQIAAAIADERAFMHDVMAAVVAEVQGRFTDKLKRLENEITNLRTELNVERRVNERLAQVEQRHNQQRVNGHANGHA